MKIFKRQKENLKTNNNNILLSVASKNYKQYVLTKKGFRKLPASGFWGGNTPAS